jgi:hypothetical protein
MKKNCYYLLIFLLAWGRANSQLSPVQEIFKDEQEIVFDTSGKMMTYPKTFVTPNTRFTFKVSVPGNAYRSWLNILKQNVSTAQQYTGRAEVRKIHDCFFTDDSYRSFFNSVTVLLSLPDKCGKAELDAEIKRLKINENLIPVGKLISNVQKQYQVKIYRNEVCIETVPLDLSENCNGVCAEFTSKSIKVGAGCESCVATSSDQFRFELIYVNPWDQTIRNWYREKALGFYTDNKFEDIKGALGTLTTAATSDALRDTRATLVPLQRWFINWFWFNGGTLQYDPFSTIPDASRKRITAQIAGNDSSIAYLHEKLVFLDSAKKSLAKNIQKVDELSSIQDEQRNISRQIATLTAEKTALQKMLKADPFLARLSSNTMAYQGRVELSASLTDLSGRRINPHKQFDAYKKFQPIGLNYFQRRKITEIPENEKMQIAVHNVPSTVAIKLDEKRQNFDDREEFTALISEQLSRIDFSSLGAPVIRGLEEFIKTFGGTEVDDIGTKGASAKNTDCAKILNALAKDLAGAIENKTAIFPPDTTYFKQLSLSAPSYRTHLAPITEFEAPFRDSITIKAIYPKDSVVDASKTFVKVGKLRFFQLMAGVAVMKEPVPVTRIDTVGGGFRVSSSDNAAKAIFGFKIYPFKNYNRDHGLLPQYPLRRFSVFAGAEILKPLDNFYLGGAYDIIPGLAFSMGTNINLQTTYQVQNNAIVNTSRKYQRSGTYYAVSVNPVLFVQFVKLFFK